MTFFSNFRRGVREGLRGDDRSAAQHDTPFGDGAWNDTGNMAGLSKETARLKAQLAQMQKENARLTAQLAQRPGERSGGDFKQMRELESILAFPGVRSALVKVLHPDTGSGGSTATRTEIFQTLMAVMERLGIRG